MARKTMYGFLLVALMCVPANAALVIDDFIATMSAVANGAPGDTDSDSGAAATAIGGFREIFVEKTGGASGHDVRLDINPFALERLNHSQNGSQLGYSLTTWDSNGAGLGGIDLTSFTQLIVGVDTADPAPIIFTIGDADSAESASGTLLVPFTAAFTEYILPFGALVPTGGTLADILDSVDSITMEIDGRARAGMDVVLTQVRADIVPEPGTLAIWGLLFGVVGLCGCRRRRRRDG